jgi:hypothetical protein
MAKMVTIRMMMIEKVEGKIVVEEQNVVGERVVRTIMIIGSTRMMAIKVEKMEAVVRKMTVEKSIREEKTGRIVG